MYYKLFSIFIKKIKKIKIFIYNFALIFTFMDKSRALSENDLQFVMPQLQNFQEKGLFGEFLKKG